MSHTVYWVTHAFLAAVIMYSRFDAAVISVAIIIGLFSNLGQSSSPYSAYSIFNKGCQYLLGDARPDAIDRQLRGNHGNLEAVPDGEPDERLNLIDIPSKFINRPCPCGSGLKAKKCHALRKDPQTSSRAKKSGGVDDYDFSNFEVVGRG